MNKTYWLYCSLTNRLITGVRLSLFATEQEIRAKALEHHDILPCCSALYPDLAPFTIETMILHSVIRN